MIYHHVLVTKGLGMCLSSSKPRLAETVLGSSVLTIQPLLEESAGNRDASPQLPLLLTALDQVNNAGDIYNCDSHCNLSVNWFTVQ